MSKPSRDFEAFKKEFSRRQEQFGLSGYQVYYKHEPDEGAFASIHIDQGEMVSTTRLNSNIPDIHKPFKDPKGSAKHEALHLLVGRLEAIAFRRFTTEVEIYEATEELVHKLERLIL